MLAYGQPHARGVQLTQHARGGVKHEGARMHWERLPLEPEQRSAIVVGGLSATGRGEAASVSPTMPASTPLICSAMSAMGSGVVDAVERWCTVALVGTVFGTIRSSGTDHTRSAGASAWLSVLLTMLYVSISHFSPSFCSTGAAPGAVSSPTCNR